MTHITRYAGIASHMRRERRYKQIGRIFKTPKFEQPPAGKTADQLQAEAEAAARERRRVRAGRAKLGRFGQVFANLADEDEANVKVTKLGGTR